jgi:subfamily B ATP-binding cassette protein MsbA
LQNLRNQFALVSQQTVLFNDTIAQNIAYGLNESEVSEEQIIEAATAAYAMEFIQSLPKGLNTKIGENGVLLSGGQRQRIAIARALLKNAPILILDEATSALDTESERQIQDALAKLMEKCTTVVIAHRLSTIENADWIVVMDNGQIVEQGTHDNLILNKAFYARLHRMQFRELDEPSGTQVPEIMHESV